MSEESEVAVRKVKSAVRTVELLEYLAGRPDHPARIRDICAALDMPRSSAHALLRTLVASLAVAGNDLLLRTAEALYRLRKAD